MTRYLSISIIILFFLSLIFVFPILINFPLKKINEFFHLNFPYFPEKNFSLGLDLAGGTRLVYQIDLSKIKGGEEKDALAAIRNVIERRVNLFGVKEPKVYIARTANETRLIVEIAGIKDIKSAIEMIGKTPFLEFKEERDEKERNEILEAQKRGERLDEDPYFKSTGLDGRYLKKAWLDFDPTTGAPKVSLRFNKEGAKLFEKITERNVGKRVAIYLDGSPISMPVVREKISGGEAEITGDFSQQEAKELAERLNAGALPVKINLISQQTVEASLGKDSLKKGIFAGALGFVLILIFILIYYRKLGIYGVLSLIFYLIFLLALFKLIGVTLTLAGIAGLILSVGMAVDASILIFERVKEERKSGLEEKTAIKRGFDRAWPSIRDANLTTLFVCIILFYLTESLTKGFALTLGVGILMSLFCALVVMRIFLLKEYAFHKI
ncbi:protein translocase subunit SecD [bacterium]|nr:protein translocase subunit SecD [bacterium]